MFFIFLLSLIILLSNTAYAMEEQKTFERVNQARKLLIEQAKRSKPEQQAGYLAQHQQDEKIRLKNTVNNLRALSVPGIAPEYFEN